MTASPPRLRSLLTGLDTVEACYYLCRRQGAAFDFEALTVARERLRASRLEETAPVDIAGWSLGLKRHGSKSGFPLILEHQNYTIQCGEFNSPSFYVTFRSKALWHVGAESLHREFLTWASAAGFEAIRPESLSRVDFTFDYYLPIVDFDERSVVSLSAKDSRHRENEKIQTMMFGKSDVVLRIYDKVAEILQKSGKAWFFELWGVKEDVWRIEWQVRKDALRRHSIRTFEDLFDGQGDVLRYLATEHDSLRVPTEDTNRSRWPVHPLWQDVLAQIETMACQGVYREIDPQAALNERLARIAVAVYGYCKRVAAITSLQKRQETVTVGMALQRLGKHIEQIHDPLSWRTDVEARIQQLLIGQD